MPQEQFFPGLLGKASSKSPAIMATRSVILSRSILNNLGGKKRGFLIKIAQVEERLVPVDDLLDADEVFCTGTAVVVAPVGSVTYQGRR